MTADATNPATTFLARGVEPDDETLRPAARAVYDLFLVGDSDTYPGGIRASDVYSCDELERVLAAVRTAIVASVLAIHAPCHTTETKPWECKHGHADEFMVTGIPDVPAVCTECTDGNDDFLPYPCPTVRALGGTS